MTVFYGLRAFVDALKRRQIHITEVLEKISNDPEIRAKTRKLVAEPHVFDGPLPGWLRELMIGAGLTEDEIAQAERWPATQKEVARAEISAAYEQGLPVHFSWDLNRGRRPFTEVRETEAGEAMIVFSDPLHHLSVAEDHVVVIRVERAGD